ncbi:hypothetical protein KM043_013233 [Ampulex compressa]|nr:hypothetical protein KM043_013233 [Ampulex compressa]
MGFSFCFQNSIRHNLSLHSRFMRVQNEGTGKSSWWMINHDAKPGKSPRRRAPLVETSKSDKGGRGRRKKTLETLRNEVLQIDAIPSPTSSVSEGVDFYPDSPLQPGSGYQMPHEFRPRSMTAPSGGRLTPNPAIPAEPDWSTTYGSSYSPKQLDTFLAGSLAEAMKLEPYQMYQTSPPGHQQQTGPPPSYFEAHYPKSNNLLAGGSSFGLPPTPQTANQQRCPIHRLQPCACQMNLSPVSGMSPSYQQSEPSPTALGNGQQSLQYMMQTQQHQQQQQMQQQQQQLQSGQPDASPPHTPTSCVVTPSTVMGQVIGALNNPTLDDLNIDSLHGGLHSSVEEVLEHELSLTGTLDFNFQQGVMGTAAIQVSEANVEQNGAISQNSGVGTMAGNAPAGVYVNTNAATPAVPPSWVH